MRFNFVPQETTIQWYLALKKPFFAPPSWAFGIAWSILYPIIFLSFGYVFYRIFLTKKKKNKIPAKVAIPFVLNLVFNLAFSPIQFGLQNNLLAALDITLVIITLIWAMKAVYKYSKAVTYLQIPYLIWSLFATVLQFSVTLLNK
ncbi:MAG: tryptophan-rich sensory protein [Candidatus Roizmanbacteria bacterium]|nr:MAG: tryptophan-rich sensory protein [Candidatus Roizmanbacteria bacterium]